MNVADDAAFVAKAVALANDPAALGALRERVDVLRRESGVFEMDGFADDFAELLQALARRRGWLGI